MQKASFLILTIYTLLSSNGFCQNLRLKINGQTESETRILDSLIYLKNHQDFLSIQSEVDSIQKTLSRMGYIENKAIPIKKVNDSSFDSEIHLKKQFKTVYIHYNK